MENINHWAVICLVMTFVSAELSKQDYCAQFLRCEFNMIKVHKRCTSNSRNEVAQACGLEQDFSDLERLMQARVTEFADCVENKAQDDSHKYIEIDEAYCQNINSLEINEQSASKSCWESVARVKQHCQNLQACCPAVKTCLKLGKNSSLTRALKEKHSIINGRTSECRNDMRLILGRPHRVNDPIASKARAVLTVQGEKIIENIIQDERQLVGFHHSHKLKTLETTAIKIPFQDDVGSKTQKLVSRLSEIIFNDNKKVVENNNVSDTTPSTTTTLSTTPSATTPTPTLFSATTTEPSTTTAEYTPPLTPKIFTSKHRKHRKHQKELSSNYVQDLVVQHPHLSFALPSFTNLTKLNIFAARPDLLFNSTSSPLYHRKFDQGVERTFARRPLPPREPPTFKTGPISEENSRTSTTQEIPASEPPRLVNSETKNKVSWNHRRHRIYASNRPNAAGIQLHLINHLRHKTRQETTQTETSTISTTTPAESTITSIISSIQPIKIVDVTSETSDQAEEDTRLIKILRQIKLKSEDTQQKMRVKSARVFDKESTKNVQPTEEPQEKKVQILQSSRRLMPETNRISGTSSKKIFMVDGSAEVKRKVRKSSGISSGLAPKTSSTAGVQDSPPKSNFKLKSSLKTMPPVDADSNKSLTGYRNKVLAIRREGNNDVEDLSFATNFRGHVRDGESQPSQKLNATVNEQLERTTIAYTSNPTRGFSSADVLIPINWKEIRRSPPKQHQLPLLIEQTKESAELLQVKMDLIRNLEEFLEKHEFEKNHRQREEIQLEEKRLLFLRRERSEYERLEKTSGYCELYSVCTDQLKFVQSQCQNQSNQETIKFFKTKFGSCNARLWKQYQETDQLRLELLDVFESCIIEEIATGNAKAVPACRKDWPVLSMFSEHLECQEKTHLLHDHCTSLGRCCDSVTTCKEEAAKHELFDKLSDSKRLLSKNAQKCKITSSLHSMTDKPRTENILPQPPIRLI